MSPNVIKFTKMQQSWLSYFYMYEPLMKTAIERALAEAVVHENTRSKRSKIVNKDYLEAMVQEDERNVRPWGDPLGLKKLLGELEYIPYTECWNCNGSCQCSLVGSIWIAI